MENIKNGGKYKVDTDLEIMFFNNEQNFARDLEQVLLNELDIDLTEYAHAGLLRKINVEKDYDEEFDDEQTEREIVDEHYALWDAMDVTDGDPRVLNVAGNNLEQITPLTKSSREEQENQRETGIMRFAAIEAEDDLKVISAARETVANIVKITNDIDDAYDLSGEESESLESALSEENRKLHDYGVKLGMGAEITERQYGETANKYAERLKTELDRKGEQIVRDKAEMIRKNKSVVAGGFSEKSVNRINDLYIAATEGKLFVVKPGSMISDPDGSFQVKAENNGTIKLVPLADVLDAQGNDKIKGYIEELKRDNRRNVQKSESVAYYWDACYNDQPYDSSKRLESIGSINEKLPEGAKISDLSDLRRFMIADEDGSLKTPLSEEDIATINNVRKNGNSKIEQRLMLSALSQNILDEKDLYFTNKNNETFRITGQGGQLVAQNIDAPVKPEMSFLRKMFRFILESFSGYKEYYRDFDKQLSNYNKALVVRDYNAEHPEMSKETRFEEKDAMQPYEVKERIANLVKFGYVEKANEYILNKSQKPFGYVTAKGEKVGDLSEMFGRAEKQANNVIARFDMEPTRSYWDAVPQATKETIADRVTAISARCEKVKSAMLKQAAQTPDGRLHPTLDDLEAIGMFICVQRGARNGEVREKIIKRLSANDNIFKEVIYSDKMQEIAKNGISAKEVKELFSEGTADAKYNKFALTLFNETTSSKTADLALYMGDAKEKFKDKAVIESVEKYNAIKTSREESLRGRTTEETVRGNVEKYGGRDMT